MREYLLIRSKRKTVALAIKEDGTLEVRAPMRLSKKWIDGFVEQKEGWIQQKTAETAKRAAARRQLTPQEEENLRLRAQEYLPQRTWELAEQTGLTPAGVKVTGEDPVGLLLREKQDMPFLAADGKAAGGHRLCDHP